MLCDECNEREATCMVTVVADGEQIKRHLCPQCLSKIHGALGQTLPGAIGIGVAGLQMTNLLSSILSAITRIKSVRDAGQPSMPFRRAVIWDAQNAIRCSGKSFSRCCCRFTDAYSMPDGSR